MFLFSTLGISASDGFCPNLAQLLGPSRARAARGPRQAALAPEESHAAAVSEDLRRQGLRDREEVVTRRLALVHRPRHALAHIVLFIIAVLAAYAHTADELDDTTGLYSNSWKRSDVHEYSDPKRAATHSITLADWGSGNTYSDQLYFMSTRPNARRSLQRSAVQPLEQELCQTGCTVDSARELGKMSSWQEPTLLGPAEDVLMEHARDELVSRPLPCTGRRSRRGWSDIRPYPGLVVGAGMADA
ncbi:hypothetical protein EVG20_g8629 [Dentipellis fragilis]|uniref:Uncharacterized protein n=1 Tax=Dentipellis fragilis TaxID=205917 RepID=A0A4Y9Y8S7_9AGAM|nr:hypothetical protein EVG20_g8629 [Dentipellis fragilis]